MMGIILSTIQTCLLLKNTSGLTVKWSLVRAFMMAHSYSKQGETTPNFHYKIPYDILNLIIIVITKLPSPVQGLSFHSSMPDLLCGEQCTMS